MAQGNVPSAIVSELLSNVSALSNALDNSRDGSATSSSLNTDSEQEIRRLFRPASATNNQLFHPNQTNNPGPSNENSTRYGMQFNFNKNKKKRSFKKKGSSVKGGVYFKEVVLLTDPNDSDTPR